MPYKLCPNCNQSSYGVCERSVWNCPHCGKDMTFVASTSRDPEPVTVYGNWKKPKKVQIGPER